MVRPIDKNTDKRRPGGMTRRKRASRKRWPAFTTVTLPWPWPDKLEEHIALHTEKVELGENASFDDIYIPWWGHDCPQCRWLHNFGLEFPCE